MILAFTGTRRGMTERQSRIVRELVEEQLAIFLADQHKHFSVRHGACKGADEELHRMLMELPIPQVEVFPSDRIAWRMKAIDKGLIGDLQIHLPINPLLRNEHLITGTDPDDPELASLLIACPHQREETLRSGTWTTVRRADKHNVKILVVSPTEIH